MNSTAPESFMRSLGRSRTISFAGKLTRFIERLGGSGETGAAFQEAFGTDYKAMELALRHYLDGGSYYKRSSPALLPELTVTFEPANEAQRDLALINLRWRVHQSADTAYRVHEVAHRNPQMARPHELLA